MSLILKDLLEKILIKRNTKQCCAACKTNSGPYIYCECFNIIMESDIEFDETGELDGCKFFSLSPIVANDSEFKWGEEVEVSLDGLQWNTRLFGMRNPMTPNIYVATNKIGVPHNYKYCRKKQVRFEVDDKVRVKMVGHTVWQKQHFSHYSYSGEPCCFYNGKTSWTKEESKTKPWDEIKKAVDTPEVI